MFDAMQATASLENDKAETCGVTVMLGWFHKGLSSGSGSVSKTSKTAQFIHCLSIALIMLLSETISPLPTLISIQFEPLQAWRTSPESICFVRGVLGKVFTTTSHPTRNSLSSP